MVIVLFILHIHLMRWRQAEHIFACCWAMYLHHLAISGLYEIRPLTVCIWPAYSFLHYSDVIMSKVVSQITSLTIVYSTVYSGAVRRKHQSSALLAFVWGIHRWPGNSPHKGPVMRKMFPFDDVIMGCWFNISMFSYQYKKSHCGDKTIIRSSYLHNGISYAGKMTCSCWNSYAGKIIYVEIKKKLKCWNEALGEVCKKPWSRIWMDK